MLRHCRFVLNALDSLPEGIEFEEGEEDLERVLFPLDEADSADSSDSEGEDIEEGTMHVLHVGENEIHVQSPDSSQLIQQAELEHDVKVSS